MRCLGCGRELEEDVYYCSYCGNSVKRWKYKFLGKYYEFDHIGVKTFDLYKKSNGKLIKRCIKDSPHLTKKSHFDEYIDILESKGYKSLGLFMENNGKLTR